MDLWCKTRIHKDSIYDCFEFQCNNALDRNLWLANGIKACGTFTVSIAQSCGTVRVRVNFQDVATVREGESITITRSDIERITVICGLPAGQTPGTCKINFTFQPVYKCC